MRFEQVLKNIQGMADEDRTALVGLVAKYPDLDKEIVPREEYVTLESKATAAAKEKAVWENWAYGPIDPATNVRDASKANWDREHVMTVKQWQAEQDLINTKARVAEMEAGGFGTPGGGDVDFDAVKKFINEQGYVKASDVAGYAKRDELLNEQGTGLVDKKLSTHGGNIEYLFTRTAHLPLRHFQEFQDPKFNDGGKWMDGFLRYVTTDPTGERVKNIDQAYEEYVAPQRLEAQKAKFAADQAAFEAQKQEFETRKIAAPGPTDDQTGSVTPPFQRMVQGTEGDKKPIADGIPFGSGVLGNELNRMYKAGELNTKPN